MSIQSAEEINQAIKEEGRVLSACMSLINDKTPLPDWPEHVREAFVCALFCGDQVSEIEARKGEDLFYHLFQAFPERNAASYRGNNDRIAERIRADLMGGVRLGGGKHLYEDVVKCCDVQAGPKGLNR